MNKLQKQFEEWANNKIDVGEGKSYSYLAWLEAQLTWRSAEEGLPKEAGNVFTICDMVEMNDEDHLGEEYKSVMIRYFEPTKFQFGNPKNVTHWLPIPFLD